MTSSPVGPRESAGSRKLRDFLDKNGLSQVRAAKDLDVSGPTINDWAHGKKSPKAHLQRAIRVWTHGEILESDWDIASEREDVDKVRPFDPAPPPPPSAANAVDSAEDDKDSGEEPDVPTGTG